MHRKIIPDVVREQNICELPENSTVYEAARQMAECDVACVVVTNEDGLLQGVVTERDVTRRLVSQGLDPKSATLKEIMTKSPDTLAPGDTAGDALELMRVRNFRHLPVVDNGKIVGMVSLRDLYATVKSELEEDIKETTAYVFGDRYGA